MDQKFEKVVTMEMVEQKIDEKIDTKIEQKMEALEKKLSNKVVEQSQDKGEQDKRLNNVIIFNIPESDKEESKDQTSDDHKNISKLFKDIVPEIEEGDISNPIRLGKKEEGAAPRPRLVRLTFKTNAIKAKILANSSKLNKEETNVNVKNKIYVNNDLTFLQRQEEGKQRSELRRRREAEPNKTFKRAKNGDVMEVTD